MDGYETVIGKKAPDFSLPDHEGNLIVLSELVAVSPVLLVFYPGDFTPVCTKQLCNYRDSIADFKALEIQVIGISSNDASSHTEFIKQYEIPFPLVSDADKKVTKLYGCQSLFMLGGASRAVMIINKKQIVLYRYVERTIITRRKSDELLGIVKDLKNHKLL